MCKVDFLCDIVEICGVFKATDLSEVFFDDGKDVRIYFDYFRYIRDNNKTPYVCSYHTDGDDLIIKVRYEV